jgi:radical SAM superfamily enzyme YgiQ (UPF0313 family)
MSRVEMERLGWNECDVIIVTGDAYVDHPSFGSAIIARVLIDAGFRTGVIAQPDWQSTDDFCQLGRPRLFFGVTAGNVDSMVAHYSPLGQKRRADAYSPAGRIGLRPNRATIVYCNRLHEAFPGVPLVLGGIEASLRRLAHYDYWDDAIRRSILLDAKADIIAYGMAETAIVTIARRLSQKSPESNTKAQRHKEEPLVPWCLGGEFRFVSLLDGIPGTVVVKKETKRPADALELPSFEDVSSNKEKFLDAFMLWYQESEQPRGRATLQRSGDRYVVQYPPGMPLNQSELDRIYALPYQRRPHPRYEKLGKIPALETVRFSITSHRGCLGSCTFCSLPAHQGRVIQWRSLESIVTEAQKIAARPEFKGHITDIGGPTANMYAATCPRLARAEPCRNRACLYPEPCPSLEPDPDRQLQVLDAVRHLPEVRKVSLGTGLRFDLLSGSSGKKFLEQLCQHYVSGQLRVAPEHTSPHVLQLMRKASRDRYRQFARMFQAVNGRLGRKQYLIPYFISGFPGCTVEDMIELAEYIAQGAESHLMPHQIRQVQAFTPTPMTLATTMYYTGIDPFTGVKLHVARDIKEKKLQRALMQLRDPENYAYVSRVLLQTGGHKLLAASSLQRLRRITG